MKQIERRKRLRQVLKGKPVAYGWLPDQDITLIFQNKDTGLITTKDVSGNRREISEDEKQQLIDHLTDVGKTFIVILKGITPEPDKGQDRAKENQIRTSKNRVCQKSDEQKIDTKKELAKVADEPEPMQAVEPEPEPIPEHKKIPGWTLLYDSDDDDDDDIKHSAIVLPHIRN